MSPDIRITMIRLSQKIEKNPEYAEKIGVKVEEIKIKDHNILTERHF